MAEAVKIGESQKRQRDDTETTLDRDFESWRLTIPTDINEANVSAIEHVLAQDSSLKQRILTIYGSVRSTLSNDEKKECSTPPAKWILMCRKGYIISTEFDEDDGIFPTLTLPTSLSHQYGHAVRVCKQCYDISTIQTFMAAQTATGTDGTTDEDLVDMLQEVLPKFAVFNKCDVLLHRACSMHAGNVARLAAVEKSKISVAGASSDATRIKDIMTTHLKLYEQHAKNIQTDIQTMCVAVKKAMTEIEKRLTVLEQGLLQGVAKK
jgi:hypothetical protein